MKCVGICGYGACEGSPRCCALNGNAPSCLTGCRPLKSIKLGVTGDGVRFIAESDESLRTSRGVGGDEVREDADEKVR